MKAGACIRCRLPEDQHHAFESLVVPAGCVCPPEDWGAKVNAICGVFRRMSEREPLLCADCEHEEPCHVAALRAVGVEVAEC